MRVPLLVLSSFLLAAATARAGTVSLQVPDRIVAEATSGYGAGVRYDVAASSTTGPVSITCSHSSGITFRVGTTTVGCTATDASGDSRSETFEIVVVDTTPPRLAVPDEILVSASSSAGRTIYFSTGAYDLVDSYVPVRCSPASGSTFPIGSTTVRCEAVDINHNSSYGQFVVTVVLGPLPPRITLPADITAEATGPDGAVVTFAVSGRDGQGTPLSAVNCDTPSGATFPLGRTINQCAAYDPMTEQATIGTFKVTVVDTTPPMLMLPAPFTTHTVGDSAIATWTATAHDAVDGAVDVVCTPFSGSTFAIGTTSVACGARDLRGNEARGTFAVTVVRDSATTPVLHLPRDIIAEATSPHGALVSYSATVEPAGVVTCAPPSGSLFPLGQTTVNCSATVDAVTAVGSFRVTVVDTTAPVIAGISASPDVLQPANHKLVPVTIVVAASDDVDSVLLARIVEVTSNEPILGPGSGNTDFDWRITGELAVELRAERTGSGADRIYHVVVAVTDSSGNLATATVDVRVSHDESAPAAQPAGRRRASRK